METNFNFKSQICTTREQSERLLALGLKKKTADMCWQTMTLYGKTITYLSQDVWLNDSIITNNRFPAWSLDRLWELMPKVVFSKPALYLTMCGDSVFYCTEDNNEAYEKPFSGRLNTYDNIIDCIEWLIKEGCFNKEYLV